MRAERTDWDRYANRVHMHRVLTETIYKLWQGAANRRQRLLNRLQAAEPGSDEHLDVRKLLSAEEEAWWFAYNDEQLSLKTDTNPAYDAWLEKHVAAWLKQNAKYGRTEFPATSEAYLHTLYMKQWLSRNRPGGLNARVLKLERQYTQLSNCQKEWVGYRAECCGEMTQPIAVPIGCNHRLCPLCAWHRSNQAQERCKLLFDRLTHPVFLTLTTPNLKKISKRTYRMYRDNVTKLMAKWRKMGIVDGGVYAIETTYNERTATWHVHAHVLANLTFTLPTVDWGFQAGPEGLGILNHSRKLGAFELIKLGMEYDWTRLWVQKPSKDDKIGWAYSTGKWPRVNSPRHKLEAERKAFEAWIRDRFANETMEYDYRLKKHVPMQLHPDVRARREGWNKANRRVCWIGRVNDREKAAKEVLKYITKSAEFAHLGECVEQFYDATKSTRMVQTFGTWYGVKLDEPCDHNHPEKWGDLKCTCGQNLFSRMGVFNRHHVKMGSDGKWRLSRAFDHRSAGTVPRPTIRALERRQELEEFSYGFNAHD